MATLVIRRDGKATQQFALEKGFTLIGQKADADINIEDPGVIGEHASILQIGDDFILNDLGTSNATLVNGQPVKKCVLKDRDLIGIGEYRMTFQDKRETDKPLGIEMEAAQIQTREAVPERVQKIVFPLIAGPSRRTELVTYAVIGAAVMGMAYMGYQSYVAREAREAQAAEARAELGKAAARRKEAEKPRDITRELMSPTQSGEPAAQTPAAGQK